MASPEVSSEETGIVANPIPLGFSGLAVTAALLGTYYVGRMHSGALTWVGMALFYGGLAQFMAGMWEFRNRDTFLATVFSSFGAFWMGLGILSVFDTLGHLASPMIGGDGITWFWFVWAIVATYMWLASFRTSGAVWLVVGLWAAAFWALWIGTLTGARPGDGWTLVGGCLAWATAVVAGYTSFAELINRTFGRIVLPEFPAARIQAMQH